MTAPPEEVLAEIDDSLLAGEGQIAQVFAAMTQDPDVTPTSLCESTDVANSGVASNLLTIIRALRSGEVPCSIWLARQTASRANAMARPQGLSAETREYLRDLRQRCLDHADDPQQVKEQERQLHEQSQAWNAALHPQPDLPSTCTHCPTT